MLVVVGSTNPTKLESVRQAFSIVWPDEVWNFTAVEVESAVAEQPKDELETITGARHRAKECLRQRPDADYFVGLEGGIYQLEGTWFVSDWAVVLDKKGREGLAGTPRYAIPEKIMRHVTDDFHLSAAIEKELGHIDIGKAHGYSGLTTGNHLTRTVSNRDAVIIALAPFSRSHFQS